MPEHTEDTVRIASTISSAPETDVFAHATVGKIRDTRLAVPLSSGPGNQMTLVRSNASLKIPDNLKAGTIGREVPVVLTVPVQEQTRWF